MWCTLWRYLLVYQYIKNKKKKNKINEIKYSLNSDILLQSDIVRVLVILQLMPSIVIILCKLLVIKPAWHSFKLQEHWESVLVSWSLDTHWCFNLCKQVFLFLFKAKKLFTIISFYECRGKLVQHIIKELQETDFAHCVIESMLFNVFYCLGKGFNTLVLYFCTATPNIKLPKNYC